MLPPAAVHQPPGGFFQSQQAHSAQHKPRCRGQPDRQRPGLCPLDGGQEQAPHTGGQHDARRHAAEHPPGARLVGPPHQKDPRRTQRGAERRQQQDDRRKQIDVHIAFPLPTDVCGRKRECECRKRRPPCPGSLRFFLHSVPYSDSSCSVSVHGSPSKAFFSCGSSGPDPRASPRTAARPLPGCG